MDGWECVGPGQGVTTMRGVAGGSGRVMDVDDESMGQAGGWVAGQSRCYRGVLGRGCPEGGC